MCYLHVPRHMDDTDDKLSGEMVCKSKVYGRNTILVLSLDQSCAEFFKRRQEANDRIDCLHCLFGQNGCGPTPISCRVPYVG